ncbi:hypothetical protein OEA41_003494 [Lepraria neglecta]|uniref:NmrA-like domain-containing protein n=1 Tax=Lepraria neglecta TaxID=209136 RepID=A0AAD9Z4F1_9LECA|nr:hypothetical protein OEA41_003494 [Lepraria neglecta]
MPNNILAIVNATGRQAASVARVGAAVGYQIRAHVSKRTLLVAQELESLDNVTLYEGSLADKDLIARLFAGAHRAFINTLTWGDEVAIGKSLADAAKKANIKHYIYSSMPDHSVYPMGWPAAPLWASKFTVENYIRQIGLPATFVYAGIYNNNFTSLPMPLFCMKELPDGSFEWKAPFHHDIPIPWLDAEHDVGPAVLQIFKDGLRKWSGHRIALAFELLTPSRVCLLFSRALRRPVRYIESPTIEIEVPVPDGYLQQLQAIESIFGKHGAPYFGPDMEKPGTNKEVDGVGKKNGDASASPGGEGTCVAEARALWGGWRGIEEYAREVFPVEEAANGKTWMNEEG